MIQFYSGFRLLRRIGNDYSWGMCAEVVYFKCSSYQVPWGVYEYLKKDVCMYCIETPVNKQTLKSLIYASFWKVRWLNISLWHFVTNSCLPAFILMG